jgi:hypothetical protein
MVTGDASAADVPPKRRHARALKAEFLRPTPRKRPRQSSGERSRTDTNSIVECDGERIQGRSVRNPRSTASRRSGRTRALLRRSDSRSDRRMAASSARGPASAHAAARAPSRRSPGNDAELGPRKGCRAARSGHSTRERWRPCSACWAARTDRDSETGSLGAPAKQPLDSCRLSPPG